MLRPILLCLILVAFVARPGAAQQASSPFAGTFADARITLTLQKTAAGYTGQVQFDGQAYPVTAQDAGGAAIQGAYTYYGQAVPFQAILQGETMTIASGGELFTLARRSGAASANTSAAASGGFSDPAWGLAFTPPAGWTGQRDGDMHVFTSAMHSGVLVFVPHEAANVAQLRAEFEAGVNEGATRLRVSGPIESFGANGIAAPVSGPIDGQPSRLRVVGLVSPHGRGVTVMGTMAAQAFTEDFARLVDEVAGSVTFSAAQAASSGQGSSGQTASSSEAQEWAEWFEGCRLSYFNRYNSSPGSGYVDESTIDLCPGFFRFNDETGTQYGLGSSASVKRGSGQWQVMQQGGELVLHLRFNDGSTNTYTLGYEDGKTYLNGRRWLRTCNPNDQVVEARPQCW